jgi:tetratricopeptide (TPR) repeat protein
MARAEEFVLQSEMIGSSSSAGRGFLRMAVTELRRAKAQEAQDFRPRIFLGRIYEMLGDDRIALELLEPAIAQAGEHPVVIDAHFVAAISCARLGDSRREIEHYDALLRMETSLQNRATALTNQAEAYMLLGEMEQAVDDYREALELIPDAALTHWGLAVALDRSGDPQGATQEAALALGSDPDSRQLMSPNVFFVPAYDRYWYIALGAIAKARAADTSEARVQWWNWSAQMWTQYIDAASASDRWLGLARAHREACQRELQKVQAKAGGKAKGK